MAESQLKRTANSDTLFNRALVALILLPPGLMLAYLGGWFYVALVSIILGLAADEFVRMLQIEGWKPLRWVTVAATILAPMVFPAYGFQGSAAVLTSAVMVSMTYHLISYEKGNDQAATEFAVTLSPIIYIGWLGIYLVGLRFIPDGFWWLLTVLSGVWIADVTAYLVGVRIGRHKMTRRLSPKKSWEGYLAGIPAAIIVTALLCLLWRNFGAGVEVTPLRGALLGGLVSTLSILGDLGESMIKRQAGVKDSSQLLPGHGGAFDRIDSGLWAGVIGYYMITLFFY